MRCLILFFATLLISSCGTRKVRFIRTHASEKQEIVNVNIDRRTDRDHVEPIQLDVQNVEEISQDPLRDHITLDDAAPSQTATEFPSTARDSIPSDEITDEEKSDLALKSEKRSLISLILAGSVYPFMVGGAIAVFVVWDAFLIGFMLGTTFLLLLASWVFHSRAKKLQYSTERGQKFLRTARILNFISIALFVILPFMGLLI